MHSPHSLLRAWPYLGYASLLAFVFSIASTSRAQGDAQPVERLADSEVADLLESRLFDARSRLSGAGEDLPALLTELSARGVPAARAERAQLARAWKAAAFLLLETEGHTPQSAEAIEIASALDPDDAAVAREANLQRRRQEIVRERLEHAAQSRAERGAASN